MIPGIDLRVDYAFKRVFGSERNRDVLIGLLNAVLDTPPGERIDEVQLLNPFNEKDFESDKLSILDIKARDQRGRLFNIEMQMLPGEAFPERIIYYWSRSFQQQLAEGEDYSLLRPTIGVCFLGHRLFPNVESHHTRFRLVDEELGVTFTDVLEIHIIELPKYQGPTGTSVVELSPLDRWVYLLQHAAELDSDALPEWLAVSEIQRAMNELKQISESERERQLYEDRWKAKHDEIHRQRSFERAERRILEKGLAEGRAAGLAEGLTEGLAEGRSAGLAEGRSAGLAEARVDGEIEMIHLCQRGLGVAVTTRSELAALKPDELRQLAEEWQRKLLERSQ